MSSSLQFLIGSTIRDLLFFPNVTERFNDIDFQEAKDLTNPALQSNPKKKETLEAFQRKEEEFVFSHEGKNYSAKVLIFQSDYQGVSKENIHTCIRVGGNDELRDLTPIRVIPFLRSFHEHALQNKNLRFIQVTLRDIQVDESTQWKPSQFADMGKVFFALVEKIKESYEVDSLMLTSISGSLLEGLETVDETLVPKTLILDRALSSVWGVGRNIMNPISCYVVYALAYWSGWAGNPEDSIRRFYEKVSSPKGRKVVVIEVEDDFYFKGEGAFQKNFTDVLQKLGIEATRWKFHVNPFKYHTQTHHSLPQSKLKNHSSDDLQQKSFSIKRKQSMASAIVSNIFLEEDKGTSENLPSFSSIQQNEKTNHNKSDPAPF